MCDITPSKVFVVTNIMVYIGREQYDIIIYAAVGLYRAINCGHIDRPKCIVSKYCKSRADMQMRIYTYIDV